MSTNSPVISTSASQPSELHDDAAMTEMLGSNEALHALFHQFDEDGNGTLSKTELEHGLDSIGQVRNVDEIDHGVDLGMFRLPRRRNWRKSGSSLTTKAKAGSKNSDSSMESATWF